MSPFTKRLGIQGIPLFENYFTYKIKIVMNNFNVQKQHQIIYCKGDSNYTTFHFSNGEKLMQCYTLLSYERKFENFVRVNKSYLVNPAYIKTILMHDMEVELKTGEVLKISRRRKKVLQ